MSEHQPSLQSPFIPSKSDQVAAWKTAYGKALWESDAKNLLTEIRDAEEALVLRLQEIGANAGHEKERVEMEAAAQELRAIKIHRLGWPDPCR